MGHGYDRRVLRFRGQCLSGGPFAFGLCFHRFGHIPKAISLPREDFEACYSKQRTLLEKHKKHPVVIYCSGVSCEDGEMVANALIALGFTDVRFYRGGWDEWTRIGLPEEKAP